MNQLRQLADHHFEGDGDRLSVSEYIMDSCNYVGRDPLTWWFFPFAIQYHADYTIYREYVNDPRSKKRLS